MVHQGQQFAQARVLGMRRQCGGQHLGAALQQLLGPLDQPGHAVERPLVAQHRRAERGKGVGRQQALPGVLQHGLMQAARQVGMAQPHGVVGQGLGLARREHRRVGAHGGQPGHQVVHRLAHVRRRAAHRGVKALQRLQVLLQAAQHGLALALGLVQRVGRGQPLAVGLAQVLHEGLLVGLRVVDHAAQLVQAQLAQAVEHHVDGGALFADEQHAPAAPHVVGNQVGDGLRLAGARRALDDVGWRRCATAPPRRPAWHRPPPRPRSRPRAAGPAARCRWAAAPPRTRARRPGLGCPSSISAV